jgi:hypothetical protein
MINCGSLYLSWYSDSVEAGRFGDRIPVAARFSAPVQNGPGAHPASYTIGIGSFPWIKRPGRGVNILHSSILTSSRLWRYIAEICMSVQGYAQL